MKRNIIRVGILGALILLCIGQTLTLWLGSMSSHNFFIETSDEAYYVFPKQLWVVSRFAYKISGKNNEESRRYRLVAELTNELKRDNIQVTEEVDASYANLLSKPGLVYQYAVPLTLNEISGRSFVYDKKEINIKIKELFVDVSASENFKTYVYLINTNNEVCYMLTLNNKLPAHMETLAYFDNGQHENQIAKYKYYKSSLINPTDSEKFKENVFCPLENTKMPILYKQLLFQKVITKGDEEILGGMVNHLFTNPIYKQMTVTKNGINFNDNLNISVMYNNKGTLEFKRSTSDSNEKLTDVQKLNKVYTFIRDTEAIPDGLREGIYLSQIIDNKEKDEVTYQFGYEYDNFDVVLSEEVKEELGIHNYLELTLKGNEIISGKWLMMVPQELNNSEEQLDIEYSKITDAIYGEKEPSYEEKLDTLECAYVFKELGEVMEFRWVPFMEGKALV